jgi:hypothetical protein
VKRPTNLRIIGKTYSVSYGSTTPLNEEDQGNCNYQQQEICVREGLGYDEERSTLLHEAIHAVAYAMNIKMTEGAVESFESGMYALLVDNPHLVAYLTKGR